MSNYRQVALAVFNFKAVSLDDEDKQIIVNISNPGYDDWSDTYARDNKDEVKELAEQLSRWLTIDAFTALKIALISL